MFALGCAGSLLLCRLLSSYGGRWGLLCTCRAQASHCGGFSYSRELVLGHMDLLTVVHGLSCSAACWIFWFRGPTHFFCISRQILHDWATREALKNLKYQLERDKNICLMFINVSVLCAIHLTLSSAWSWCLWDGSRDPISFFSLHG